ncbi:MAG: hypothetical protein RSC28_05585 [Bacteroidales bacterium]
MKTINYLVIIALTIFTTTSCVENSGKYKALVSQNDSLQANMQTMENDFNETLLILNEVEEGFRSITAEESKLTLNMENTSTMTKKQQVAMQVTQIKDLLAQNRASIKQLQSKLAQSKKNSKILTETIKRMEEQLNEKTATIAALQNELAKKNIKIEELVASVDNLNSNVANLEETKAKQESTIKTMDTDMNTVWYCVATTKELKAANIKSEGKVMNKDFKKEAFIKGDLRQIKSIPLNCRKGKILSSHPQGSYTIEQGTDKLQTLIITDPQQFWSISKYLVIQK